MQQKITVNRYNYIICCSLFISGIPKRYFEVYELIKALLQTELDQCAKDYATKIISVVSSVSKISSSLNKLKKNSSAATFTSTNQQNDDDEKIRLQIKLDVERFLELCHDLGVAIDRKIFGQVVNESNDVSVLLKSTEEKHENGNLMSVTHIEVIHMFISSYFRVIYVPSIF